MEGVEFYRETNSRLFMPQPSTPSSYKAHPVLGNLLCLIAAICWGLNVPANKVDIPHWISPDSMAVVRIVGACAVVWLLALFIPRKPIARSDRWTLVWGGVAMFGFIYVFSLAFTTASPIDVSIILTFQPLMVVVINAIFKHHKIRRMEMVGMAIAFGGALLIILLGARGHHGTGRLIGDLWALGSAVCYSSYLVIIQDIAVKYRPVHIMKWIISVALVIALPVMFISQPWTAPVFHHTDWLAIGALLFIVLISTCFGYLTEPWAIKMVGNEIVAMYQYLVPIVSAIAAIILGVGKFEWYQPVSFIIIVGGLLLVNISYARARKKMNAAVQKS